MGRKKPLFTTVYVGTPTYSFRKTCTATARMWPCDDAVPPRFVLFFFYHTLSHFSHFSPQCIAGVLFDDCLGLSGSRDKRLHRLWDRKRLWLLTAWKHPDIPTKAKSQPLYSNHVCEPFFLQSEANPTERGRVCCKRAAGRPSRSKSDKWGLCSPTGFINLPFTPNLPNHWRMLYHLT